MEVITIVEGHVPDALMADFEQAYASLKKGPFPEGWVSSSLLMSRADPDFYRIETVWKDMAALERYREKAKTPAAVDLFGKIGVEPTVETYEVVQKMP